VYSVRMPKLWNDTIEAHRREVREAILATTATLVAAHGLQALTMSQIAEGAGVGRATLYKYFPDIDAILLAWHERQVKSCLEQLGHIRDQSADAGDRLQAVFEAYALICHERHDTELAALLHRGEHITHAQQHLSDMIRDLLMEVAKAGNLRTDVAPGELATYCLHALTAASSLPSKSAVRRLVAVTLSGLRPPAR